MPHSGPIGERIAYTMRGSGPPLILLHGFAASSATFASNLEALSRRFTVVTVDLLGHGDSDAPADAAAYTVRPTLERLLALIDELRIDRAMFGGHALGGALALRFAFEYPDRVAGLVLINSTAAIAGDGWREAARPGIAAMAARVRADGLEWLHDSRMNPLRAHSLPPAMRARLALAFQALTPQAVAGTAEGLAAELNTPELLPALDPPALLVIGDRDAEFVSHVDSFLARAPDDTVTTVVLPGAGHAANIDDPAGFAVALGAFAERIGYLHTMPNRIGAGNALVGAGATLVAGGVALLAAAFLFAPGQQQPVASAPDEPAQQVAGERATATPTSRTSSARTTATRSPDATTPSATVTETAGNDDPTPGSETPTPGPTGEPTSTTTPPEPTATPVPPTPVPPTPVPPSPTATSVTGPFAAIEGPSVAEPGVPILYKNVSGGGVVLRQQWSFLGTTGDYGPGALVTFPGPGCYVVSMVAFFSGGATDAASLSVSVGGDACQ